jgi:hypothetical protein
LIIISITLVAFCYVTPGAPLISLVLSLFALLFDLLAFSTKFYTSFFMPFLTMKDKSVVLEKEEPFFMASTGNAIVVRRENDIYASVFIKIPTYKSSTEMNADEKTEFARLFSRALTLTKNPVKFSTQLYVINKDSYISNIRNRLNEVEERYQNATVSKDISKEESERIKGEVTMWHNLLDNVSRVRSQSLETYAMTTSQGNNEEEAVNLALQEAGEVVTGISSTFGISASIIEGEEMLKFIEPNYMIPLVTISEQMRERTIVEGV